MTFSRGTRSRAHRVFALKYFVVMALVTSAGSKRIQTSFALICFAPAASELLGSRQTPLREGQESVSPFRFGHAVDAARAQ